MMDTKIAKLMSEGDFYYAEAKSKFFLKKELKCIAPCGNYKALKIYLDAYEMFLYAGKAPSVNYHVLVHMIIGKDPEFEKFKENIYKVKCFAEESQHGGEEFYLFSNEINSVLKIVGDIRKYIINAMQNALVKEEVFSDNIMAL
ncbi:MAG: hypothetical protein ACERKD_04980 [Prolixibacteraceae bacterium]